MAIVNPHELTAHSDWPVHRVSFDPEGFFDFIHQIEWFPRVPVVLIDESENRNPRILQIWKSLRVWGSIPLAPSITMTAESTAIKVR